MSTILILSATALAMTAMLCLAALSAWRGWLVLRRQELAQGGGGPVADDIGARIELAAVRERLKKLEAIASGVEL
jgi:hypothetical protein